MGLRDMWRKAEEAWNGVANQPINFGPRNKQESAGPPAENQREVPESLAKLSTEKADQPELSAGLNVERRMEQAEQQAEGLFGKLKNKMGAWGGKAKETIRSGVSGIKNFPEEVKQARLAKLADSLNVREEYMPDISRKNATTAILGLNGEDRILGGELKVGSWITGAYRNYQQRATAVMEAYRRQRQDQIDMENYARAVRISENITKAEQRPQGMSDEQHANYLSNERAKQFRDASDNEAARLSGLSASARNSSQKTPSDSLARYLEAEYDEAYHLQQQTAKPHVEKMRKMNEERLRAEAAEKMRPILEAETGAEIKAAVANFEIGSAMGVHQPQVLQGRKREEAEKQYHELFAVKPYREVAEAARQGTLVVDSWDTFDRLKEEAAAVGIKIDDYDIALTVNKNLKSMDGYKIENRGENYANEQFDKAA